VEFLGMALDGASAIVRQIGRSWRWLLRSIHLIE
jgi:hypothetical protein